MAGAMARWALMPSSAWTESVARESSAFAGPIPLFSEPAIVDERSCGTGGPIAVVGGWRRESLARSEFGRREASSFWPDSAREVCSGLLPEGRTILRASLDAARYLRTMTRA